MIIHGRLIVNSVLFDSARYVAFGIVYVAYTVLHGLHALSFTILNIKSHVGLHTFAF